MATPEFVYQDPLPLEKDSTRYRLLSKEHVSVTKFEGKDMLKVEPEALTLLANVAVRDVSFLLRAAHLGQYCFPASSERKTWSSRKTVPREPENQWLLVSLVS